MAAALAQLGSKEDGAWEATLLSRCRTAASASILVFISSYCHPPAIAVLLLRSGVPE
jgi:hypothetical protein